MPSSNENWWVRAALTWQHGVGLIFATSLAIGAIGNAFYRARELGERRERIWTDTQVLSAAPISLFVLLIVFLLGQRIARRVRRTAEQRPADDYLDLVYHEPERCRSRINATPGHDETHPCIRDTKIRVSDVIDLIAAGQTASDVIARFPELDRDDVTACVEYTVWLDECARRR